MSALPPKADIAERRCHVRFVPKAAITSYGVPIRAEVDCWLALAPFFKQSERATQSIGRYLALVFGHAVDFKLEP